MMMITDTSAAAKHHAEMSQDLRELGEGMGLIIRCQREEIFTKMHRI